MNVLSIVLPVFLVIVLGGVLTRCGFLSAGLISELNRLTYYVGLPAFLFTSVSEATYGGGRAMTIFAVMGVGTLLALLVGYVAVKVRGVSPQYAGTFLHAAIRGNLAYIGLPVISLALAAHPGPDTESLQKVAVVAMAPLVVVTNTLGVLLLLAGRGTPGVAMMRSIAWQLVTNPLLIATGAGLVCAGAGLHFPHWFSSSVAVVGQMALPLALLGIGGTLIVTPLKGKRTAAFMAALLKVAAIPLLAWPVARWLGLNENEMRIALLFLACPTAAASYTLAGKLGGDEALAASSVVISTGLSVLSLSAVLVLV